MFTRAWRADFNLDDSEGRIVSGIAVPYNSPTVIAERGVVFEEHFEPGAFRDSIGKRGDRIKVLGFHDHRAMPLGKPVRFDEQTRGLYMEARISDTRDGNDALTLVRDGVLDGFSVGFTVPDGGDNGWQPGIPQRAVSRAQLLEVSLVNFPAYDRARVESIRSISDDGSQFGNYDDLHPFYSNPGTGLCLVCNLSQQDGPHGILPTEEPKPVLSTPQFDTPSPGTGDAGGRDAIAANVNTETPSHQFRPIGSGSLAVCAICGMAANDPMSHHGTPGTYNETNEDTVDPTRAFAIDDREDLTNAIHAVGRGKLAGHNAIRKYIMRRAREMGLTSLIPSDWAADGTLSDANRAANELAAMRYRLHVLRLEIIRP